MSTTAAEATYRARETNLFAPVSASLRTGPPLIDRMLSKTSGIRAMPSFVPSIGGIPDWRPHLGHASDRNPT